MPRRRRAIAGELSGLGGERRVPAQPDIHVGRPGLGLGLTLTLTLTLSLTLTLALTFILALALTRWADCAAACEGRGLEEPWALLDAQAMAGPPSNTSLLELSFADSSGFKPLRIVLRPDLSPQARGP